MFDSFDEEKEPQMNKTQENILQLQEVREKVDQQQLIGLFFDFSHLPINNL